MKEENDYLRDALKEKERTSVKGSTRPQSATGKITKKDVNLEKEKELLKTLDRLKRKVWKNIAHKVQSEKDEKYNISSRD